MWLIILMRRFELLTSRVSDGNSDQLSYIRKTTRSRIRTCTTCILSAGRIPFPPFGFVTGCEVSPHMQQKESPNKHSPCCSCVLLVGLEPTCTNVPRILNPVHIPFCYRSISTPEGIRTLTPLGKPGLNRLRLPFHHGCLCDIHFLIVLAVIVVIDIRLPS